MAASAAQPSPKPLLHRVRHLLTQHLKVVHPVRRVAALFVPTVLWLFLFSNGVALLPARLRPPINVTLLPHLDATLFASSISWFRPEAAAPWQDLLAAVPYTIHPVTPFIFIASYLLLSPPSARRHILTFVLAFGLMNLAAVSTHLAFPTAPPWYFLQHGTAPASYDMKGDPAILGRLDTRYNISMYHRMYGDVGKLVFGAWPSLHAAWPYLMARFRPPVPYRPVHAFQFAYMLLVWWAAIYLHHHYAADVLGGVLYAEGGYRVAKWARVDREGYARVDKDEPALPIVYRQ